MKKFLRASILITGIVFFIWFFLPLCLFGVFNAGNTFGMVLCIAVSVCRFFLDKIFLLRKSKSGKVILCVSGLCIILLVFFTSSALTKMSKAANNPPAEETTVVVLGCMVYKSGPSLTMLTRLESAYRYLAENPDIDCVLSGGKGDNEPMSEAQAMYDWLVEKGIDKSRLYREERSTSTVENLTFSKELIKKEGLCPQITIVTNDFHQYRSKQIADSLNIKSYSISGKTPILLLPTYYLRELGGIFAEAIGIIRNS